MSQQEIYGLLLAGGQSRRMGTDKALLRYDGGPTQIERASALLKAVCPQVFLSLREGQNFPLPEGVTPIYDQLENCKGPLCGILSALQTHPQAHWLIIACDLPFLEKPALDKLIKEFRRSTPRLIAYRSTHDSLPEPLCAIYPAGCGPRLLDLAEQLGKHCPRKLLIEEDAELIEPVEANYLDNVNTPEEFAVANRNEPTPH
ncbi:MAG: molybdenum cofactor guanylyltransferase [Coraliomargaritaceae bacterium]